MRNYPEWVIAFAAITSIGAVSVSLNAWWTDDELDYALEDCGATVLIADVERVERGHETAGRLGCRVLAVRAPGELPEGVDRWEDVRDLGAPMPEVVVTPDDDATILYTSGTTGQPQGRGVDPPRRRPGADGVRLQGGARPPAARGRSRGRARATDCRRPSSSSCRCSTSPAACR